jgi:hypothetical protein
MQMSLRSLGCMATFVCSAIPPASRHLTRTFGAGIGLSLALLALNPNAAWSHETDQYTLPLGRQFADLGPHLTSIVHAAIVKAVEEANAEIERSLRPHPPVRDTRPTDATPGLQSADYIAGKVWLQLLAAFPTNELLDNGLAAERTRAQYPGLITAYRAELSIYDDPLLTLDITKLVRVFFRAATINADGQLFGTDKVVHFIHLGRIYHSRYQSARDRGIGESAAIAQILASTSSDPLVSENWLLGMFTTGISSNADLAADYAGFKFYRNLTEAVRIGKRTMPPMLMRSGPYWRLNPQVNPSSDFFTAFITPHWNEALNPNVYAAISRARIKALLKQRCADLLDWYRDEHGRALTQKQFAAIEVQLSTWFGEDYGYQNDGGSRVSIATTCFQSGVRSSIGGTTSEAGGDARSKDPSLQLSADQFGRTALWWAAKDGRLEDVERLLAAGADPAAPDIDGESPLHAAARWGRADVVELLLSHQADPNLPGLYGMTPLQIAVLEGQAEAVVALLRHGADPNARDSFGKSPLHEAALRNSPELATLLLQYGGDPAAMDASGRTPLDLAKGAERLVKVLSQQRGDEARAIHVAN